MQHSLEGLADFFQPEAVGDQPLHWEPASRQHQQDAAQVVHTVAGVARATAP